MGQDAPRRRGCFGCLAPLLVVAVVGVAAAFIVGSVADEVRESLHEGERLVGPAVVLDVPIRFELRRDDTGVHHMSLGRSGPVTVTVEAVGDFDPKVRVVEIGGPELGADDDSGGGHDSLLAVELAEGRDYEVEVTEFSGDGGEYVLLVRGGEIAPVETAARVDGPAAVLGQSLAFGIGDDQIGVHPFVATASGPVAFRVAAVDDFDPIVTVTEPGGAELGSDDDSGGDRDALLIVEVVEGRTYEVRVAEFSDDAGSYELLLTSLYVDGSPIGRDSEVAGAVDDDETARHRFTGPGGEVTVRVVGEDGFDPVLTIRGGDGEVLGSNDDADGLDSRLTLTLPLDAEVTIEVEGFSGNAGSYTLVVE